MGYSCHPFSPRRDRAILKALWKRNLSDVPERRFDWLYEDTFSASNVCTCLLFKDDVPCGSLSVLIRGFAVNDEVIPCGTFIDFIVDKSHRTVFPALTLVKAVIKEARALGLRFLWAFPNEKATAVFQRCGFTTISAPERWTRVIDSHPKVGRFIQQPVLKGLLSTVANCAADSLLYLLNGLYPRGVEVDLGFQSAVTAYSPSITGWRPITSRSFVSWRYGKNPIKGYSVYSVRDRQRRVSIIYFRSSSIAIIEAICFSDVGLLGVALYKLAQYLKPFGIIAISMIATGIGFLRRELLKAGFLKVGACGNLLGIKLDDFDSSNSDFQNVIMFDGDLDI